MRAAVTSEGLPLTVVIVQEQKYDQYRIEDTLGSIKVKTGYRPIIRPNQIGTDSIYDNAQVRDYLRRRTIKDLLIMKKLK